MISLDDKHTRAFERDLKAYTKNAIVFANRNALNKGAKLAQRHIKQVLAKKLTLRNKFTINSIRVIKANQKAIRHQRAVVGSTSQYLPDVEFGGSIRSKGKQGVPVPSRSAAGEGRGSIRSKRLVRLSSTRRRITLGKGRKGKGRKQRNVIAFRRAQKSGRKFVYMDTRKGPGLFKIMGGKRKPRAELIWSLSRKTVPVKRRPWMAPTVKFVVARMPLIYRDELRTQVIRHGLFKTRR